MPKGVPSTGFRKTKRWLEENGHMPKSAKSTAADYGKEDDIIPSQSDADANFTDDEITARIAKRFNAMEQMAEATVRGINRSLICYGPAGLGKSYGVNKVLDKLEGEVNTTVIKGFVRPTGLYKVLHEFKDSNSCIVFDDADSIFGDDIALNLLKSACDMTGRRRLSWLSERSMKDEMGSDIPNRFEFKGSVIFITNYDFDAMIKKGHRYAPHFDALISRSHYLDLALKTRRDYILRIKDVALSSGMLAREGLTGMQALDVIQFIETHVDDLRSLNLRAALKIGGLMKMCPDNWEELAKITCCINK